MAQANQVLQASLSRLADEPDLEKFLGHVLTVYSDRFHSSELTDRERSVLRGRGHGEISRSQYFR